jgi:hypothetical protein
MTLIFPSSPTTGQEYTDSNGKVWVFDGIKWDIASAVGIKQFFGTKVVLNEEYFLTKNLNAVEFDVSAYDTNGFFMEEMPTKIIIPRTGYYRINALIIAGQEGFGASYIIQLKRNNSLLVNDTISSFQSAKYDEVRLSNAGDTIELFAAEIEGVGTLLADTFIEVHLQGYTFAAAVSRGYEFSGVRAETVENINLSSTSNAIAWDNIIYNVNADAAGDLYWDELESSKFIIQTSGYYRIRSFIESGPNGSQNSYVIIIKLNDEEFELVQLGPNDTAELDATYFFDATDYLEVYVENSDNVGTLLAGATYFEIIRLGV